jgi:hypothetical protein
VSDWCVRGNRTRIRLQSRRIRELGDEAAIA